MSRLVLGLVLATLVVSEGFAEPPNGFSQFPWGTSPEALREQLLSKRCSRVTESRPLGAWFQLVCYDYAFEGISAPSVGFDFEPSNALAGYSMRMTRGSYRRFRDLALERFGPPTSRRGFFWRGTVMSWTSDTVTATLTESCGQDVSCMDVSTRALEDRRRQLADRERRETPQGF